MQHRSTHAAGVAPPRTLDSGPVNGRLKDEFAGRHVRVHGHAKVLCRLMFGIIALAVDQFMRRTL